MIVGAAAADKDGESASKINHRRAMGDHRPLILPEALSQKFLSFIGRRCANLAPSSY
jgi:hypothetical protein